MNKMKGARGKKMYINVFLNTVFKNLFLQLVEMSAHIQINDFFFINSLTKK